MISSASVLSRTNDCLVRKVFVSSLVFCSNLASSISLEPRYKSSNNEKWNEPEGFDSSIVVYNPLIKRKSKLILQNKNVVKWYSCGPTVYDSAHIGHASTYVKFDIIRRILLNFFDIDVYYLLGITDIDDKIILRSRETKEDFRILAKRYEIEFFDDLNKLNVLPPTMVVRVSDHIPEIISFVDTIFSKGCAYKSSTGSVYFATKRFPNYGKIVPVQQNQEEKENSEKQNSLDFTLWKAAKPQEPHWDSPWGPGRPGWHIECSAMASKVLGPRLDIHSGGMDLMFPHHENEEAQSCVHHNTSQWVNYWLYTGQLNVKGDVKMSKSLKNTISISQLLETYTSNHFRMLCLISPYRNRIDFSEEAMQTASGTFRRVESFVDECRLYLDGIKNTSAIDEAAVLKKIQEAKETVRAHFADDFNTAKALDEILRLIASINAMLAEPSTDAVPRSPVAMAAALHFVKRTFGGLGFTFATEKSEEADQKRLSAVLDAAVGLRSTVREIALQPEMATAAKPQRGHLLQACDRLRNSLSDVGVELKDHGSQKTTWSLKS